MNSKVGATAWKSWRRLAWGVVFCLAATSRLFATTAVLSIPTNLTGNHGTTVFVPVSVAPGTGILGIDMSVHYDPAVLTAVSVATSGIAQAAGFAVAANVSNPGVVVLTTYATSNPLSGSGEVVRIKFTVAGVGGNTSNLTITNASVNEGQIPSSVQNGLFTVTPVPLTLTLPNATGDSGSSVDVPLSATHADGALSIVTTIQYNASVVDAQNVTVSGIAQTAGFGVVWNVSPPGSLNITLSGSTPLSGSGELAKIHFHVGGAQSSSTNLTFSSWSVNNGAINTAVQNGSFTVNPQSALLSLPSDAVGSSGSTVQVPVSVTPGDGVCRVDATIQFDASVIQAQGVTVSGIAATAGFGVNFNNGTPGVLTISAFSNTVCLSGSGEFLRVQFQVVGSVGASSPLTFASASINNGQIGSTLHQGVFTVVTFCATAPNGTACNDLNACTQTDTCQGGVCVGTNPISCSAQDQCHNGVCNPADGTCSQQAKPDNSACNDGNACTQTDTCQGGVCTGANPVSCTPSDSCHLAGTCDPASGVCSNPQAADGAACSDGNACTQTDTCHSGVCIGSNPLSCSAIDACHVAGTCNPASGTCSNPQAADGTACNDGNACTQSDTCQGGVCTGGDPVSCPALDSCHLPGVCSTHTGVCTNPVAEDGTACDDGDLCTQGDACSDGVCTGGAPVTCVALDSCHIPGVCSSDTGCTNPVAEDGTACDDGNACTQSDSCVSGECTGGSLVTCSPADSCHVAGSCDPATGGCSSPPAPDGTACDDGNACTVGDACTGGACLGGTTITVPPEIQSLLADADKATYSWSAATFAARYDVVRGSLGAFPVGPGGADEACFDDLSGTSLVDPVVPSAGTGFWYLSRGENACGTGTLGTRSDGSPRSTTTCP